MLPLADVVAPGRFGSLSNERQVAWAALMCGVVALIGLWWRRRPTTALDHRVFAIGAFLFFTQGLLALGAWSLGLPALQVRVLMLLWGVIIGVTAIALDRWLLLGALAYLAGFLITTREPEASHYLTSATNLAFALNVLWRWRPRTAP